MSCALVLALSLASAVAGPLSDHAPDDDPSAVDPERGDIALAAGLAAAGSAVGFLLGSVAGAWVVGNIAGSWPWYVGPVLPFTGAFLGALLAGAPLESGLVAGVAGVAAPFGAFAGIVVGAITGLGGGLIIVPMFYTAPPGAIEGGNAGAYTLLFVAAGAALGGALGAAGASATAAGVTVSIIE